MRFLFAALIVLSSAYGVASAEGTSGTFDWNQWRNLAVQDGGRRKPLDTLAWETWRMISNRTSMLDPDLGRLDATAFYLVLMFDYQPGNPAAMPHGAMGMDPRGPYFAGREPDKWDRSELILVESPEVRKAIGMPDKSRYISPLDLSQARLRLPMDGSEVAFMAWAEKVARSKQRGFTPFEQQALDTANRLWSYADHRTGRRLEVLPIRDSASHEWVSVSQLRNTSPDSVRDPDGSIAKLREGYLKLQAAWTSGDAQKFNAASADWIAALREAGPKMGEYPDQKLVDLEVRYNHWAPFRFAWILALTAALLGLLSMGTGWKVFYVAGLGSALLSLVAMAIGFALRVSISGRAPVTNMYESVVYVGMGVAFFGLLFELIYRRQFILVAAAAVSTVALMLADTCPAILDPALKPLQPVLRSNFWLVTHVMTITLSYAAFALALGISDITLGYFLAGANKPDVIAALSKFSYRALQVGVVLLAAGTILGGVWADYSWGRFWAWDPKEVWALVALLGYLAVLHARFIGWVGDLGLSILSVLCFQLVVMAWYGVNFVLGAGLHSYGFGNGGNGYVYAALGVQFLYVILAAVRAPSSPTINSDASTAM